MVGARKSQHRLTWRYIVAGRRRKWWPSRVALEQHDACIKSDWSSPTVGVLRPNEGRVGPEVLVSTRRVPRALNARCVVGQGCSPLFIVLDPGSAAPRSQVAVLVCG